jgi:hypothetical protein
MVNEKPTAARSALNASATLIDHKLRCAALRGLAMTQSILLASEQSRAA